MASFEELFGKPIDWNTVLTEGMCSRTVPAGWYQVRVVSMEKQTSRTGGKYISGQFSIIGSDYAGRPLYANFTVQNKNRLAVEMGFRSLGKLCVACGKPAAPSTDVLLNCVCDVRVILTKNSRGEDWNEIKEYRVPRTNVTSAPSVPATPARASVQVQKPESVPAVSPTESLTRPWETIGTTDGEY